MMALRFIALARSRIWMISSCCSAVLRPGLLGQSMLFTVATQEARNSRAAGGGSLLAAPGRVVGSAGTRDTMAAGSRRHEISRLAITRVTVKQPAERREGGIMFLCLRRVTGPLRASKGWRG